MSRSGVSFAKTVDADHYRGFGSPQHEDGRKYTYPNEFDFGTVTAPPVAQATPSKGVDVVAHWYNDFGLSAVARAASSANGWYGWYDWQWNFTTDPDYDIARHPIQGFYKGDNADVLGWQCYWLAQAGVTVASITQAPGFSRSTWSDPASMNYWVYQLLNNVPNFKSLQYMLWLKCTGTTAEIEAQNDELVATYAEYPGAYSYTENGLIYACVFAWDLESIRGVYDAYIGQTLTDAYLIALSNKFKAIGYDGVMVMARNAGVIGATPAATLKPAGAYVTIAEYETVYGTHASYNNSYADYVDNVVFPSDSNTVLNVVTSALTQSPHPSGYSLAGTTPELFRDVLSKAIYSLVKNDQKRIVTIYNVSEWAEGGPGLIPNKKDGFGYLDAVRSIPVVSPRATTRAGTVIGYTQYRPGTDVTFGATGASYQDVNAANLSVTFTAPASGKVFVALSSVGYATTADESISVYWSLREATTDLVNVGVLVGKGTPPNRRNAELYVSGLTPGASYTYKWAHRAGASAQSIAHSQGPNYGTSVMKVTALA